MRDVDDILKERGKVWGDAVITHWRIAKVWTGILGREVTAYEVALCLVGLKAVRASINPKNPDSSLDGKAYFAIFDKIMDEVKAVDNLD